MARYDTLSLLFTCSLAVASSISPATAEDSEYGLLGSWGGAKPWLEGKGVAVELIATHDYIANVSGGIDESSGVLGNIDLTAEIDTASAGLWENGTFFFYFLGNYGRNPTEYVGDLQTSTNIETYDTFKLYEGWYQHEWSESKVSVLFGLHDMNSEFLALDSAGTLINSSFGISPDVAQVGPSIFSTTALGARVRWYPKDSLYLQSAVYDGIPGDPERPRGTRVRFDDGDGVFLIGEAGLVAEDGGRPFKLAIGGWYHTAEFEDVRGEARDENAGGYLIGERMIYAEDENFEQGLSAFFQFGKTYSDRNAVPTYVGGGLAYRGLIPGRDNDTISTGVAYARVGHAYRSTLESADKEEIAVEATYRLELLPYFSLQPDVQYIMNPSADKAVTDAWVLGMRTELAF